MLELKNKIINKIISIKSNGFRRYYLNIDEKEALSRFHKSQSINGVTEYDYIMNTIEFGDEFGGYDIFD